MARTKARWRRISGAGYRSLWIALLCISTMLYAQTEPCSIYERDGVAGFGLPDFWYHTSEWRSTGDYPDVGDVNDDGIVDVLDLIRHISCTPMTPGLVGQHYGFFTGDPDQTMAFPDFDALTIQPTVVKAIDVLEEFEGWNGFLNSDMRYVFGTLFEGYLAVPETATYTLEISGREGCRVYLNGDEILFFDGSPRTDSHTMTLQAGYYPLRVEFYTVVNNASISLTWSSNGSVIGPVNQLIDGDYLLHPSKEVAQHAITEMDIVFDPPSGSRVAESHPRVQAWLRTPAGNVDLNFDNHNRILYDGKMDEPIQVAPGLNGLPYRAEDEDGRVVEGTYYLYYDAENVPNSGLAVNLYAPEWYWGVVPHVEDMEPFALLNTTGTQFIRDGNENLFVDGRHVNNQTVLEAKGIIEITTPGEYRFRIDDSDGGLYIDGEEVAGIANSYTTQWRDRGTLNLDAGYHHFRVRTANVWQSPTMRVFWTPPGGSEELIPNSVFRYGFKHRVFPPDFTNSSASGGRESDDQIAEYLFEPGAVWQDSSGNGYHLFPDPRAIPRDEGGITYQTAGGTVSHEAGVQLVSKTIEDGAFSLEVDFVYDDNPDWHERGLIGISAPWTPIARIYSQYDDVFFELWDDQGNSQRIEALDVIAPGERTHVVGTFNSQVLKLYVDGVLMDTLTYNPTKTTWLNRVTLDIGQSLFRRDHPGTWGWQMKGTFLAAAAYARELGPPAVMANMQANQALNPIPPDYTWSTAPQFPPAGSSAADLDEATHILNRLSFGPTPQTIDEVISGGVDNWIAQQLDPDSIDDSESQAYIDAGVFIPTSYARDLAGQAVYRMATSKRQLREVMTQFWENHFNTQWEKVRDLVHEQAENDRFRELALTTFGELLTASAMHFPMTVYLDSDTNIVGAPNENYAREILELHTQGVNNGYTQDDIVEAARCFTGWTVKDGYFYFNAGLHDYGEKNLLGMTIPAGGGISDGLAVIEHLATSTYTAEFISWKLCQLFVADDPPADILTAAQTAFTNSDGDIKTVLNAIFSHALFRTDTSYRGNKIKTPLEFTISVLRATETPPVGNALTFYIDGMGMELFNYADPTGFDEESVAWMDTNSLLARWNLINEIGTNRLSPATPALNIGALIERYQLNTYTEILDFFEDLTTHGSEAAGVRAITESWLTDDNPGGFILTDEVMDTRVRQTLGLYLRLPEFNNQ